MPRRKAGEVLEYVCKRCGRRILADVADVMPPDECPYPACGGVLAPTGRGLTVKRAKLFRDGAYPHNRAYRIDL